MFSQRVRAALAATSIMWAAASAPAAAQISQTISATNAYAFSSDGALPPFSTIGGSTEDFFVSGAADGTLGELRLQYEGTASDGGFFFLHNNYCLGPCAVASFTTIVFDVTNNGSETVDLRFDSQITPGHLGRLGTDPLGSASFDFNVYRADAGAPQAQLYNARADIINNNIDLFTGDVALNGLTRQTGAGGAWEVYDWGTTNLSIAIGTLAAGQSTRIIYDVGYLISSQATCVDLSACSGFQVAFGDPRNKGGSSGGAADFARGFTLFADGEPEPVIGRVFDPLRVPGAIVLSSAPRPGPPPAFTAPHYVGGTTQPPGAVPEPATWATMIAGFALVGGAVRRRRRTVMA